ncbi:hypothetical protein BED47_02780 [Gottfriedia luciferensis]|uniref:DUF2711 domain-containing protein n=1 Tax=Gottfriedia luciferensis TaxID=178774 RepID=A0ABX3A1N6_9BACI|nr:DUF2711 family protein [Gottfriedia luciferensis]ODG93228.1 hypothetical protein BED47_02780 [Gottfriedia luciferensis]
MLNYIWLDDKSPILDQLPNSFKSAAILFHPFIQMPLGWEKKRRNNEFEHTYPSDEEILKLGKQVSWMSIMQECDLTNFSELAIALQTSICALKEQYARDDLAEKLNSNLKQDCFYPDEDDISLFFIKDIKKVLESKGAKYFSYSNPILDESGTLEIKKLMSLDNSKLSLKEVIISDENMDFAFMSVFDTFITVFMTRDEKTDDIVKNMGWESIVCDDKTYIDWYWSNIY